MDEDDERSIELSSIAAIFPELVVDPSNPFAADLDVPVTPEKPLKIRFQASTQTAPPNVITPPSSTGIEGGDSTKFVVPNPLAAALNVEVHQLSHLPPLKLHIDLPDGYPQTTPPSVTIRSEPIWLPQKILEALQDKCTELWQECGQDQVVYTFIDYIQQEAEKAFGLSDHSEHNFQLSSDLKLVLLDYDFKRKREQFENETFECGICLDPKKGRICHRLILCGHVFCVACLQDFFNNCITEGDIDNVKCLDPGCGKDTYTEVSPGKRRKIDRTLNPSELLQIPIKQEQVQRYVHLKRKKRIEADKNTVYCPRQWCQGAARSKKHPKLDDPFQDFEESGDESDRESQPVKKKKKQDPNEIPMSDRLAVCEDCSYAFCSVCKKGWHGERANCNPRRRAELNAEEEASLEYMKKFSTPCPTCNAPAQKSFGCNHMICFKCKTHFCYLCSSYLMPENPYRHFNDLKSTCYMRLWELEGGDGADVGMGFAGGNPAPWEAEESDSEESEDEEEAPVEQVNQNWDDDTEDEEPAPDQRRPDRPHIEIVNFAGNGGNRQIAIPDGAQPAARAPAAIQNNRPRGGNRGRGGNGRGQPAPRIAVPPPAPAAPLLRALQQFRLPEEDEAVDVVHVAAAPGQGNNGDAALQRFLRLALQDREDEWDSDEDDGPNEPIAEPRRNRRR